MNDLLEEDWVMFDNQNIIYFYVKRKKIKNMYMRFSEDGKLIITTSKTCKLEQIEEFVKDKKKWIIRQQSLQEKIKFEKEKEYFEIGDKLYFLGKQYILKIVLGNINSVELDEKDIIITVKEKFYQDKEYIKKLYEEWLKNQCLKVTSRYAQKYFPKMKKYKIPFPNIQIKKFKARWGCCIPKKLMVEFAMNLVKTPEICIEYVVVHELAHFKFIHHNSDFYNFVEKFIPDWKMRRNILNKEFGRIIV